MIKLNEMATSRQDMISDLKGRRYNLITHICRIFMNPNGRETNHWIGEVTSWLSASDSYQLKPRNHRPKKDDFLNYLLREVDTVNDAYNILVMSQDTEVKDPTVDQCKSFMNKWKSLRLKLADDLSSNELHDKKYFEDLIRSKLLK